MYSFQGTYTSNEGETRGFELDLPLELETIVRVDAVFDGLEKIMVGTYNKKSKILMLKSESGYISSLYTIPLTIIGNVMTKKVVGTFNYGMTGSFELTYHSKKDIEKRNKDDEIEKIKSAIKDKDGKMNEIMEDMNNLTSQLANLEFKGDKKRKIRSEVLVVERM